MYKSISACTFVAAFNKLYRITEQPTYSLGDTVVRNNIAVLHFLILFYNN